MCRSVAGPGAPVGADASPARSASVPAAGATSGAGRPATPWPPISGAAASHPLVAGSDDAHTDVHLLRGGVGHCDDEIEGHLLEVVDAVGLGGADTRNVDHPVIALANRGS